MTCRSQVVQHMGSFVGRAALGAGSRVCPAAGDVCYPEVRLARAACESATAAIRNHGARANATRYVSTTSRDHRAHLRVDPGRNKAGQCYWLLEFVDKPSLSNGPFGPCAGSIRTPSSSSCFAPLV